MPAGHRSPPARQATASWRLFCRQESIPPSPSSCCWRWCCGGPPTCGVLDLPLNFANIIALPLLFGVGVAFNIYFVTAWRAGETAMLESSLMRAVVFSALTTATAFGALWLSSHPGTASMGRLLTISLGWELLVTILVRPALLARPAAG
jgi:predicted exporter